MLSFHILSLVSRTLRYHSERCVDKVEWSFKTVIRVKVFMLRVWLTRATDVQCSPFVHQFQLWHSEVSMKDANKDENYQQ